METSKRIKELRLANKMTQQELASKLGLQKSIIAKYESGRVQNIKRATIDKMAEIFCCTPTYVMGYDTEEVDKQYYLEEAMELAEFLHKHPEHKILFDVAMKVKVEDIDLVLNLIRSVINRYTS